MVHINSLDESKLIATILKGAWSQARQMALKPLGDTGDADIKVSVFTEASLTQTIKVVKRRVKEEGLGFLTKVLPRLCKAFDKALCAEEPLTCFGLSFTPFERTDALGSVVTCTYPRFMGEFFQCVLHDDGTVSEEACVSCVRIIRQVLYLFYKYELPYDVVTERDALDKFVRTDEELVSVNRRMAELASWLPLWGSYHPVWTKGSDIAIVLRARKLLHSVFAGFDPMDINPRNGPGAVSGKEKPWAKFRWTNIPVRLAEMYPIDAYFYASMSHVCDTYPTWEQVGSAEQSSRVVLVPKDSRGPRVISCEPVAMQWIQQGLLRSLIRWIERHPLTKGSVKFTDQRLNQVAALVGSNPKMHSPYATLDLNEASDRVSIGLVRLLFPSNVLAHFESCRSLSTVLPDKRVVEYQKFAPMGSALCFPIMALTIWALLASDRTDQQRDDPLLVYGDDVIVPTAQAERAIAVLETFGLKVNRAKSCLKGLFRESCGMDAFKGFCVTPFKLRTVWDTSCSPEQYASWVEYARSLYTLGYYEAYDYVVEQLTEKFGYLPDDSVPNAEICLPLDPTSVNGTRRLRRRWNSNLQRFEYSILVVKSLNQRHAIPGWEQLLRFFSEKGRSEEVEQTLWDETCEGLDWVKRVDRLIVGTAPLTVSTYALRGTSILVRRWR